MKSRVKRQHHVPVFYLNRFSSGGKVCVRWRDGRVVVTSPLNVAVETGFYDIPNGEGGKSDVVETRLLAKGVEGPAASAMEAIDKSGQPPPIGRADRKALAMFLALQMTRTTAHRDEAMFQRRVLDWAQGREVTRDLVAEYLEREHLGFKPRDPEVEGAFFYVSQAIQEPHALTSDWAVRMMLESAGHILPLLLALHWTIEVDPNREFITSDKPVVLWRKRTDRDNYEGLGAANSDEIRFPLDPGKQLVVSRRKRAQVLEVAVHRARRSNRDVADSCHQFIVGNPDNRAQVDAQRLDARRPVIRFWNAPWYAPGLDGRMQKQEGDVTQMMVPRRAGVGPPPASDD
jgi:hypothetical protein